MPVCSGTLYGCRERSINEICSEEENETHAFADLEFVMLTGGRQALRTPTKLIT
jgi:hypothetical protein